MSNAPIASLEELLGALSHERGLAGRLRVLGQSWSLLRSLSPGEREKVALRVGSSWAWKRVEKAFLNGGELSENERLVGRVFEQMGDSDPKELRNLARMVKAGDRGGAQDLLMIKLTDALETAADEEEQRLEVISDFTQAPSEPAEAELDVESNSDAAAAEPRSAAPPESAFEVAPEVEVEPAVAVEAAPAPAAAPRPSVETAPPSTAPSVPRSVTELDSAPSISSLGGLERLQALRSLERDPRPGIDLGQTGRAELVESLGGGWASRRALSRLIRERSLDDVDEAIALIQRLERSGQQTWCLADLLHHWELGPEEIERVLALAPTAAAHRRLSTRVAAARI